MGNVEIKIMIDERKLTALNYSLKEQNTTAQKKMDEMVAELYESAVPEVLRKFVAAQINAEKSKRPSRASAPRQVEPKADSAVDAAHRSAHDDLKEDAENE